MSNANETVNYTHPSAVLLPSSLHWHSAFPEHKQGSCWLREDVAQ